MNGNALLNIGIFGVFVAATLVVVIRASRNTKTAADYLAAGRAFTGPQNGIAIAGDYLSAASFLGIAGAIAVNGYDGFLYSIGFLVAWLIALLLVAELPLLFGALMRPLGAALSATVGALVLVGYDLTLDDGRVPYSGVRFDVIPGSLNVPELVAWCGRILEYIQQYHPAFPLLFLLWPAMALAVSLGELTGQWLVGLGVAAGGGVLGYALLVSERSQALTDAVISLGLAAIMYAVLRYLVARVRG